MRDGRPGPRLPALEIALVLRRGSLDPERRRLAAREHRHNFEIETIPNPLRNPFSLDVERFISAIQKARGLRKLLTAAAVSHIREEHTHSTPPWEASHGTARTRHRWIADQLLAIGRATYATAP